MKTSANIMCNLINLGKGKQKRSLKEDVDQKDKVQVFMNTWANYNEYGADEGITPTGWMSIDDAIKYCKKYSEYEPFINDYENSPIELSEYDNAPSKLEQLKKIEAFEDPKVLKNAIETDYYGDDIESYIDHLERGDYVWFPNCEDDFDLGKDYIDMVGWEGISNIERYFKEDDFRNDIYNDEKDYYASENGLDTESDDFPEDDFEEWMNTVVEDRKNYQNFSNDDQYFDYNQLGEDLEQDGYTFTSDGCICLY